MRKTAERRYRGGQRRKESRVPRVAEPGFKQARVTVFCRGQRRTDLRHHFSGGEGKAQLGNGGYQARRLLASHRCDAKGSGTEDYGRINMEAASASTGAINLLGGKMRRVRAVCLTASEGVGPRVRIRLAPAGSPQTVRS